MGGVWTLSVKTQRFKLKKSFWLHIFIQDFSGGVSTYLAT